LTTFGLYDAPAVAGDLRIEHVTIVSAERTRPLRNANVSIHDDRIVAISIGSSTGAAHAKQSGAENIDGRGLYLAPGLIDSHVHLAFIPGMTPDQENLHPEIARAARDQMPRSFLYFGFTTLIDLISTPAAMARWKDHEIAPDTYFCGGAARMDGYPMNHSPAPPHSPARYEGWPYMIVEAADASSLPPGVDAAAHTPQAVVARMKADGAICAKTFFERGFGSEQNLPVPTLESIRALVRAAHAAGLPVLLHANSSEAQTFGLDAGVDIIAHGLWVWNENASGIELTPSVKHILDRVVQQNVGWQPTIQVVYGFRDLLLTSFLSDPMLPTVFPRSLIDWYKTREGQWFHDRFASEFKPSPNGDTDAFQNKILAEYANTIGRVERATGYLAEHHGRLLFGTDTPSAPIYSNPPGLNGWWEMQRLIDAGVKPARIFQAATLANARALKLERDIGTVEVGKRANLLLLRQDPTRTIQAYTGIVKVILRGRVIDPSELVATRSLP
jgi:imidazolonepropionase-like amidohydrolase